MPAAASGPLRDLAPDSRYEMAFLDGDDQTLLVFADYAVRGKVRVILHVEADPGLRGSGAAGVFMQALAEHARSHDLRLLPVCGYAVAWMRRHPEHADLLAQ